MAATDAPATLQELRNDFIAKAKEVAASASTTISNLVDSFLNQALQDMHQERWYWAERRNTIRTNPTYTTGTVTNTITSLTTRRTLTGTSTLWNTANSFGDINGIGAGAKISLSGTINVHLILTVDSDTGITLDTSTPFAGATALSGSSYTIYQDEYALQADFDRPSPIDAKFFDEDRTIRLLGPQEFELIYPRNNRPGRPRHATVKELGPSGSASLRPRLIFGPAPDTTYIIPYRYYTSNLAISSTGTAAANMTATSDQPIVPLKYRQGIVFRALADWFDSREKNPTIAQRFKAKYDEVMLRARAASGQADDKPRLRPKVASYWRHRQETWVNGATRSGPRRWDGNAAFDEMRF